MRVSIDWQAMRLDAHAILKSFSADLEERREAHNGLQKRWPDRPDQMSLFSTYSASCISELDVRQAELSPFSFLNNLVEQSLSALLRATLAAQDVAWKPSNYSHVESMFNICRLSDKGVAEVVPFLLPKLQRKALLSISSLLSDERKSTCRNQHYLLKKVEDGLLQGSFEAELVRGMLQDGTATTHKVLEVLKNPNSYKSEAEMNKGRITLLGPERSSRTAAIEALMQLDNLPLISLHVMLEMLREKNPDTMIGKLPSGSNKDRLTNSIIDIGMRLLSDMRDEDPLPEALRRALVVMSLSARHVSGDDGKLIEHLGPHPQKVRTQQRRLIYSLSRLKLLSKDNVAMLFQDLATSPKLLVGQQRPDALRKILLDCLLRSEIRRIPNVVRRTLRRIKKIVKRRPKAEAREESKPEEKLVRREEVSEFKGVRLGKELEATLRVSAHLQQTVRESLLAIRTPHTKWRKSSVKANGLALTEERIVNACDRAAGVGYTLVGCAIEGMTKFTTTNLNSKCSLTDYLRSGTDVKGKVCKPATHICSELDQVTFILNAAESLVGAFVLRRVKIRLGQV